MLQKYEDLHWEKVPKWHNSSKFYIFRHFFWMFCISHIRHGWTLITDYFRKANVTRLKSHLKFCEEGGKKPCPKILLSWRSGTCSHWTDVQRTFDLCCIQCIMKDMIRFRDDADWSGPLLSSTFSLAQLQNIAALHAHTACSD